MYLPVAKSVLIPLGLTAAASAIDAHIRKEMFVSGRLSDLASLATTLITLNEEVNDIMEIVISFEKFRLFIKGVSETIKNEAKNKKEDFSVCY